MNFFRPFQQGCSCIVNNKKAESNDDNKKSRKSKKSRKTRKNKRK